MSLQASPNTRLMNNTLRIFITCTLALTFVMVFAQEDESSNARIFHSFDYNLSGHILPVKQYDMDSEGFVQLKGMQLSLGYEIRINLLKLGDNFSIGLNSKPSLGISVAMIDSYIPSEPFNPFDPPSILESPEVGFLTLHAPTMITCNIGAGSTFDSVSDRGINLGGGLDFLRTPIFAANYQNTSKNYIAPFIKLGLRKWIKGLNSEETLREYYLRVYFLNNDESITIPEFEEISRPFMFAIGANLILNY